MNRSFQVTYILRYDKTDNKGQTPIYLRITVDGQKTEISIKRKIKPIWWSSKKNEPLLLNEELNQLHIYLNSQKVAVYDAYSNLVIGKQLVTVKKLRDKLLGNDEANQTLLELTIHHNEEFKSLIGTKYTYGSYKNYKTTLLYLKEFIWKLYKRKDLSLSDVNYQFAEKYFKFLVTNKPCNHNGATKHLQRLKKLMNYGVRAGIMQKNPIETFQLGFKPFSRQILNWDDLMKLKAVELSTITLKNVRDVFLFQCFTGLSYVDVKNIIGSDIKIGSDGKLWIVIHRQKTGIKSSIPLLMDALVIIERYNHNKENSKHPLLPVMSNQKMNSYLKNIATIAGININLSTHTARHTFATTVTLANDVPIETVSKMLGHHSLKTTQIYARVIDDKISRDMSKLNEILKLNQE